MPPRLALTICAGCVVHVDANAAAMSAFVPLPPPFSTRSGIRWTFQFTPATPIPLLPRAPIVPATCVPWPL